jgi:hypothetical protein
MRSNSNKGTALDLDPPMFPSLNQLLPGHDAEPSPKTWQPAYAHLLSDAHPHFVNTLFLLNYYVLILRILFKSKRIDVRVIRVQKRKHPEGKPAMEPDKMDLILPLKAPSEERTTNMN